MHRRLRRCKTRAFKPLSALSTINIRMIFKYLSWLVVLCVGVYAGVEARAFTPLCFRQRNNPMIIVKEYHTEYSAVKAASYVWADEPLNCPSCDSSDLIKKGWRSRKLITLIGSLLLLLVQRVRCKSCGKIHHVLPDIIVPYKRYDAETIEAIIEDNPEEAPCGLDEQEIHRVKKWWTEMKHYISKKAEIVMNRRPIQISPKSELTTIVRALANAHLWPGTRSVLVAV